MQMDAKCADDSEKTVSVWLRRLRARTSSDSPDLQTPSAGDTRRVDQLTENSKEVPERCVVLVETVHRLSAHVVVDSLVLFIDRYFLFTAHF